MVQDNYLLDTNIVFNEPYILNKFDNCNIYIPGVVLEELDKHKYDKELGMQVRIFNRILDKLHETNYMTDKNCHVMFISEAYKDSDLFYLGGRTNDNIIIHTAKCLNKNHKVVLLSNDMAVRIKARNLAHIEATGLTQEIHGNTSDDFYKGYLELNVEDELINTLYSEKFLSLNHFNYIKTYPHMFFILRPYSNNSKYLIGKVDKRNLCIELIYEIDSVYGISPKNLQQLMAMHLLLDPEIPLVSLTGKAGSGKTLITLAAALALVQGDVRDEKGGLYYSRITCATPTVDMGRGLGFLPGDKDEKLAPYVQSFFDALEYIYGGSEQMKDALQGFQDEFQIDALNYIRGRSLPGQYFILDEAQNLTKHEIKTTITRMGEGSKIVIMGDPAQIDVPYLDKFNNGLTYTIEKFKDKNLAGHIELIKGVRSPLADMAADIL
jgi:PhoH-like ATPase